MLLSAHGQLAGRMPSRKALPPQRSLFGAALLRITPRTRTPRASLSLPAVVATLDFLNYVCQEGDRKFESHLQQLCHAYYRAPVT